MMNRSFLIIKEAKQFFFIKPYLLTNTLLTLNRISFQLKFNKDFKIELSLIKNRSNLGFFIPFHSGRPVD